ncbi:MULTISPECIES: helix-turn-helix domain-containing protein [unclassified Paenibacillus]|uniref:helix-turn-helix domain-containing protein n=1 Tax=unclassified Paenibacillus TaxID=185978 RepID=UPI002F41E056
MKLFRNSMPRSGLFLTLLCSYISIFMLPMLIGVFMFQQIQGNMIRDSNRVHLAMLEQVKIAAESQFNQLDKLMLQVAMNPRVQWVLGEGINDYYGSRQMDFLSVIQELGTVQNLNLFVWDVFVYLKNTDSVLTTTGKVDADTFFNELMIYDGKNAETIRADLFSGTRFRQYYPNVSVANRDGTKRVLAYVQSLPPGEGTQPKGYFVAFIHDQELRSLSKQAQQIDDGDIYIVNEHQQVLFSTAPSDQWEMDFMIDLPNGSGSREEIISGEARMLSYTTDQKGWAYISVVDKESLLADVHIIKERAMLLLLLCLVAGAFGSYVLAYRYYSPLREMVRSIRHSDDQIKQEGVNELDIIRKSIVRSFEENSRLSRTLSQHIPAFKSNFLSRLLAGQVTLNTIDDESLSFMDVRFEHDCYAVIIVHIDDCRQFVTEDTEKEWTLVRFVLSNLSSHLLSDDGYTIELGRNRLALLINCEEPLEDVVQRLDSFIRELKQAANERFRMQITIGVSDIHQGLDALPACYQEALEALDYHLIYGQDVIIYYRDVAQLQTLYYHYPPEQEAQMINLARSGDDAAADQLLDDIYQVNMAAGALSPDMGKLLFYDLMGTLMKIVKGLTLSESERAELTADSLRQLAECSTAEDMLVHTKQMYQKVCKVVLEAKTDRRHQLYNSMTVYIEQHVQDSNLSLTSMSEHFQLTPQYLSTFFKKYSGQNVTDFISRLRVRKAKTLLLTTTLTVSEIAQKIGYANEVGFIRLFKKMEGVTPGKYRDMAENEPNP